MNILQNRGYKTCRISCEGSGGVEAVFPVLSSSTNSLTQDNFNGETPLHQIDEKSHLFFSVSPATGGAGWLGRGVDAERSICMIREATGPTLEQTIRGAGETSSSFCVQILGNPERTRRRRCILGSRNGTRELGGWSLEAQRQTESPGPYLERIFIRSIPAVGPWLLPGGP